VGENDDELTLFWRGVRHSAAIYVEMLERFERGEQLGEPQPEKGRLYRVRDRTWRAERQLAAMTREGLLQGLRLPTRVRWFSASPADTIATRHHLQLAVREEQ
jgi:methionyl-tRNA formyltransferase